jgi:ABC-type Zn uptake system ZnuABC Zn-binding protein ZnuA
LLRRAKTALLATTGWLVVAALLLSACQPAPKPAADGGLRVLAVEAFLADIAQNVAGERLTVETLIPSGLDPHAFEPTPRDVVRVADCQALIVNGAGLESWLDEILANAGGQRLVIAASGGLAGRTPQPGEGEAGDEHGQGGDPHFWLDPVLVVAYVENIRLGLSQADPDGAAIYAQNAAAYTAELQALDAWIKAQAATIPAERRLLVTNHESFGYFADRYGFKIVGAVIPSQSTAAAPSAQQMAALITQIKAAGAPAIVLETGANPQLAEQIAQETGAQVITGLRTHSLDAQAPTYIDMMKLDVTLIVQALQK